MMESTGTTWERGTSRTKVRDVVRLVATSDLPVRVIDTEGRAVGSVDRVAVLSVVAGEDLSLSTVAGG